MKCAKWKSFITLKNITNSSNLKISSRKLKILPQYIGSKFLVYNGKKFHTIEINSKMVGHKFGQFAFTKTNGTTN